MKKKVSFFKKIFFFSFSLLLVPFASFASWTDSGSDVYFTGGNVGIGTSVPSSLLNVGDGYTSVGGLVPLAVFSASTNEIRTIHLQNTLASTSAEMRFVVMADDPSYLSFSQPSTLATSTAFFGIPKSSASFIFNSISSGSVARDLAIGSLRPTKLFLGTNNLIHFTIDSSGNIGVGTTSPLYKLDVVGELNSSEYCLGGVCITSWSEIATSSSFVCNNMIATSTDVLNSQLTTFLSFGYMVFVFVCGSLIIYFISKRKKR